MVNEKAVIRKLNKHILLKFFLMCILCYIGGLSSPDSCIECVQSMEGFCCKEAVLELNDWTQDFISSRNEFVCIKSGS